MSSLFSSTQPATGASSSNLFGLSSNTLSTGLNNQQQFQNTQLNSLQQRPVIDSRFTIRQLTTIIPEWRGHFDIADAIMSSQELMLTNVSIMVSQLNTVFDQFKKTFELTRSSMNDISMQQNSLNDEVQQRLKYQDTQNLATIKSRRLCEMLINSQSTADKFSIRVPNHINVQLTRELYEKVKSFKSEIDYMQNEVQMLKQIDLQQVPNFVDSVLQSHSNRIMMLSDKLVNQLNAVDYRTNTTSTSAGLPGIADAPSDDPTKQLGHQLDKYGYSLRKRLRLWAGLSDEPSSLRRKFMEAVGVPVSRRESEESQLTDIKLQIRYLRKFNSSYDDPHFPYLKDYGFNIKDLLTSTPQNQSQGTQSGATTGLFGTSSGTSNLFGSSGTTTSNLFGSSTGTGLFGSSNTGTSTGTNLFGTTQSSTGQFGSSRTGFGTSSLTTPTQSSTTGGLFGNTSTTGFGSSTGTGTGLFGSSSTTNTGTGLFGSTSNTGTTTGTGLFGNTTGGSSTGLFGNTSSSTPSFGASNTTTGGTGLFGSTNTSNTGTGLFGGSTTSTFGSNTGGFGTNTGGTGLFGSSNTSGFGSNATNTSTGLFGSSTNTGFGNTNTGSSIFGSGSGSSSGLFGSNQQKSTGTELAIYQPTTSFSSFNRK